MTPRAVCAPRLRIERIGMAGALGVTLTMAACNPIYYSPNTQNVPLLAGAGDLMGKVDVGEGRFEVQGAYALTGSLAVQLHGAKYEPDNLENGDGGSGSVVEGGIGYFGPLGQRLRWEVFGLVGSGSFENHRPSSVSGNPGTTGDIEGNLLRFGIQPAVGYRGRNVEAAFSTRLASIKYSDVQGSLRFGGQDQVQRLRDNDTYTLLEPGLTIRGGLPRVKLQLQIVRSVNLTEEDFQQDDGMLTFGLLFRR